ncbi:MAG TPA: hypothetical protein VFZ25_06050 [Chloroflexota bacterium]|nr:hypothetical protein [Chloroflexota bacterium]
MAENRTGDILSRIAVAVVAATVVVNVATGPGAPSIVNGVPVLVAHGSLRYTSWFVYWLNTALFAATIVVILLAFFFRRVRLPHASSIHQSRSVGVLLQEHNISAVVGRRYYNLVIDARLTRDFLELQRTMGGGEILRLPINNIPVVWFIPGLTGWRIDIGGEGELFRAAQIYPRNPRRWYEVFSSLNIPIRPADLSPAQLPSVQVGWLVSVGCTVIILATFVLGILAMLASILISPKP